jgi:hypothetical protein
MSFTDAAAACSSSGGFLVSILNNDENKFVADRLAFTK